MIQSEALRAYHAAHQNETSAEYDFRMKTTKINPEFRAWQREYKAANGKLDKLRKKEGALIGTGSFTGTMKQDEKAADLRRQVFEARKEIDALLLRQPIPRIPKKSKKWRVLDASGTVLIETDEQLQADVIWKREPYGTRRQRRVGSKWKDDPA